MASKTGPDVAPHLRAERTFDDVRLSPWQRWPMVAILAGVFLFASGPVWRNPFDLDRAIWFSYAPIPLLVVACLAWKRRLSWLTAFLNTVEIVVLKFTLTYMIAMPLWAIVGPPRPAGRDWTVTAPASTATPPEVTPWPAEQRGGIRGVVTSAGEPLGAALVYVSEGLDSVIEPWPAEPRFIDIDAAGFAEPILIARRWQPLRGRSADRRLHTLFFEQDGRVITNLPLLPSGEATAIVLDASGVISVRCAVHGESANVLMLQHPHVTRTDPSGRFALDAVPALPVKLAVWKGPTTDVTVPPGTTVEVTLSK